MRQSRRVNIPRHPKLDASTGPRLEPDIEQSPCDRLALPIDLGALEPVLSIPARLHSHGTWLDRIDVHQHERGRVRFKLFNQRSNLLRQSCTSPHRIEISESAVQTPNPPAREI